VQEIPVKRALFGKVQRLTLYFVDNFSTPVRESGSDGEEDGDGEEEEAEAEAEVSRMSYVAFKGEWMQLGRAPTQILYEAVPNPSDHALKGKNILGSGLPHTH
jgi:hypothetical protein